MRESGANPRWLPTDCAFKELVFEIKKEYKKEKNKMTDDVNTIYYISFIIFYLFFIYKEEKKRTVSYAVTELQGKGDDPELSARDVWKAFTLPV